MEWLVQSVEGADIEEVTDDMLEKMIISEEKLAVLFYEENDDVSTKILEALETIDDDLVNEFWQLKTKRHKMKPYWI